MTVIDYQFQKGEIFTGLNAYYEYIDEIADGYRSKTLLVRDKDKPERIGAMKIPKSEISKLMDDAAHEFEAWERLELNSKIVDEVRVAAMWDYGSHRFTMENGKRTFGFFTVQKYIPGQDLKPWCKTVYGDKFSGIPDADTWFRIARDLLETVALSHQMRVVHGDIWPPNIIMTIDGMKKQDEARPVLIDFGQAWLLDRDFQKLGIDHERYPYYAPERLAVERSMWYTPADIYAVGAVLCYLATGQDPPATYDASNPSSEQGHIKKRVIKEKVIEKMNSKLYRENPGIVDIIMYALRPRSEERASNANYIIDVLELLQQGSRRGQKLASLPLDDVNERKENLKQNLVDLDKAVRELQHGDNEVFYQLMCHEVKLLKQHFDFTLGGTMFTLPGGDRDNLVRYFMTSLSCLQEGDEVFALTTPIFWLPSNFGANGRALTMLQLAIRRGVSVKWVLLIVNGEQNEYEVKFILEAQRKALEETRSYFYEHLGVDLDVRSKDLDTPGFYLGYRVITPGERDEIVRQGRSFVIFNQKNNETNNYTLFAPTYTRKHGQIASIRYWSKPPWEEDHRLELLKYLDDTVMPVIDFGEVVTDSSS